MPVEKFTGLLSKKQKEKNFEHAAERIAEHLNLLAQGGMSATNLRGQEHPFTIDHCIALFPNPTDPNVRFVVLSDPSKEDEIWQTLEELDIPIETEKVNLRNASLFENRFEQNDLPSILILFGHSAVDGTEKIAMSFPPGMPASKALEAARISMGRYGAFEDN